MNRWIFSILGFVSIGAIAAALRSFTLRVLQPNFDNLPASPNTTPVVLAVTRRLLKADMEVVIVRRATTKPHDLIRARPIALNAELLARAVETLHATRRRFGRVPMQDLVVKVERPGAEKPTRSAEAEGWIRSLRRTKRLWLAGVGAVPLITLHVFDNEHER